MWVCAGLACDEVWAMGVPDDYATIAQGVRESTLKEPLPEPKLELHIQKRFSKGEARGAWNSFSEQFDSTRSSSLMYSFGNCTLTDSKKHSMSREMATSMAEGRSPGPAGYTLKGSVGPKSAQHIESSARHATSCHFLSEFRDSADVRERKARGEPNDAAIAAIRAHAGQNTFLKGRAPSTLGSSGGH